MRVLVTGSSGFLGQHVCKELTKQNIQHYGWSTAKDGDLCYADLTKFDTNFTHIIHLAAKVGGISANIASPYDFIRENLMMGLNIIDYARTYGISVVMASTVCAYPEFSPVPFKEENLWNGKPEPSNSPYGISKKTLMEALDAARVQYGLNSVVLNLANMYGLGDSNNLKTNHVVPAIFQKCKNYHIALRQCRDFPRLFPNEPYVHLYGDGTATRDLLHVSDGAQAIIRALTLNDGPVGGINIGTGEETSIKELASCIFTIMSVPLDKLIWNNDKPNGQQRRCLDISRANKYLNWEPKVKLHQGLIELSECYRSFE